MPGNHDVQRSVADRDFANRILADRASSYLFGSHAGIRHDHPEAAFDSLVNYRALEELLGSYDQDNHWGYAVTRGPVSFVGLNSAWLCCARPEGEADFNPYVYDLGERGREHLIDLGEADTRSRRIEAQHAEVMAAFEEARDQRREERRARLAERGVTTSSSALSRFFQRHGLTRKKDRARG